MSFIETLDSLALRKSELIERFDHLIASKSHQELEEMAQVYEEAQLDRLPKIARA